ncbi:MAG: nuclear transport factor 2 family protein [Thermoleophilaceae bacterium]|nr:nuclear transport factor 2 family protein [Thermoleophilaceae bacterium]
MEDLNRLCAFFDPEVELRQRSGLVGTGTYRGHDGLVQAARDLADAFGVVEFAVARYFDKANLVVTDVHVRASGRTTALETEIRIGHVFELRDGRVARWTVYPNFPDALEAVGLSE